MERLPVQRGKGTGVPPSASPAVPDGDRYLVVDGRRWRRTDPGIPDALERELVAELMAARRAVKDAADDEEVRSARRRVQDAKVALGERGEPWWEPSTVEGRAGRIGAAARALLRHRRDGATICPSDVARVIGGDGWRSLTAEVRARLVALAGEEGADLEVRQQGEPVDPTSELRGPIRFGRRSDAG